MKSILSEIDDKMPRKDESFKEIYSDMVEQGSMQSFGFIINQFEKCDTEIVLKMLDILLDFSAYIDPTATDNPNRPDNVIAIQAFIHSNIITRIFKLTENVN